MVIFRVIASPGRTVPLFGKGHIDDLPIYQYMRLVLLTYRLVGRGRFEAEGCWNSALVAQDYLSHFRPSQTDVSARSRSCDRFPTRYRDKSNSHDIPEFEACRAYFQARPIYLFQLLQLPPDGYVFLSSFEIIGHPDVELVGAGNRPVI